MIRAPIIRPASDLTTLLVLGWLLLHTMACGDAGAGNGDARNEKPSETTQPLFREVASSESGIAFANMLDEDDDVNYFKYEYLYNGGGVAVGDINNDGLPDLYFTGNMVPDRLYLNKGDLRFEDITAQAIPEGALKGWHSGVTMADVDGDGWLDIFICRSGPTADPSLRTNILLINNGDGTFADRSQEWGLTDPTHSTQAAFFDMDGDGDLDLYVMNHAVQGEKQVGDQEAMFMIATRRSPTDRLYRNDGGRFTDITEQAGIWNYDYGLGLSVSDFNGDGRPDLYVACDYTEMDHMYINKGNGRFREEIKDRTRHISNFAMGCDVADYNNDGLVDIVVLDMVSEDHVRSKRNMGAMSTWAFWRLVNIGHHYQYMSNTLQLNNGNGTFSEVGQMAGIAQTDWSWAPLLADLDNDGWKDLLVTNGYKRDVRDNDAMRKLRDVNASGTQLSVQERLDLMPSTRIRNYLFRNNGDLTFTDVSEQWGFKTPHNSNGAAYADLDGDGDLDLVINNIDGQASLFQNMAMQQGKGNYLRVEVEGANSALGMGAQVTIRHGDDLQFQECWPTRGYQSSMEPVAHFGLGKRSKVDEVEVRWPDGRVARYANVDAGQVFKARRDRAIEAAPKPGPSPLFVEVAASIGLKHEHKENEYDDFKVEVLLPHKQSEHGPQLAVGDADGDGLDDLFVGGPIGQAGTLYLQRTDGSFVRAASQPWQAHGDREDLGALFFDANGDGHQDLYVTSGGHEVELTDDRLQDRLYLNDGKGRFTHAPDALPPMPTSTMRVAAADVDGDGHLDLFVGGRTVPGNYPKAPRSHLLINDGQGRFRDATEELAPDLMRPGLVTDIAFMDLDGDGDMDMVLAGEWMPLTFMENDGGRFTDVSERTGLKDTEGWWFSLTPADLDGDGRMDLVCGNIGWNNKFRATPKKPLNVYWHDMDDNGRPDIVLAKGGEEKCLPVRGRECSSQQVPGIIEKFPTYERFAAADVFQIYGPEKIREALHLRVHHMRSGVLMNKGGWRFDLVDLPNAAQVAPIMNSIVHDFDGDGNMDILVAGNMWGAEVETVRYDAGTGLLLLGDGQGGFTPVPAWRSGFFAWEHVRDIAMVQQGRSGRPMVVVGNNNGPMQVFRSTGAGPAGPNSSRTGAIAGR